MCCGTITSPANAVNSPIVASANTSNTGSCGENITWSFDSTTGTLTISGTGSMYDYIRYSPWFNMKVTSVVISDGITSIGNYMFGGCENLTSVTIPNSVTSIGDGTFRNCTSLANVYYNGTESDWNGIAIGSNNEYLNSATVSYNSNAFQSTSNSIMDVLLLKKHILGISNLESDEYDINTDGKVDFLDLMQLKNSIFNESLKDDDSIDDNTIDDNIVISDSGKLGSSATWAFSKSTGTLILSGDGYIDLSMEYVSTDEYGNYTLNLPYSKYNDEIKSIVIDEGISMSKYVCSDLMDYTFKIFKDMPNLQSVTLPSSLEYIYNEVLFENCPKLKSISISSKNPSYVSVDNVIFNKNKTQLVAYAPAKSDTTYTIPSTVTDVNFGAFYGNTYLQSVTIPNTIETIQCSTFANCTALKSVSIPSSVVYLEYTAFTGCTSLSSLTISDGVKYIDSAVFADCTSLKSVTIPSSVTSIGSYAFGYYDSENMLKVENFTIYGVSGSQAETYANDNGFNFISIG